MPLSVDRSLALRGTPAGPKSKSAIYTYNLTNRRALVKKPQFFAPRVRYQGSGLLEPLFLFLAL
jgi:hypothetical protein